MTEEKRPVGRPKGSIAKERRVKISITLPLDVLGWLRKQKDSQAKTVEKALRLLKND